MVSVRAVEAVEVPLTVLDVTVSECVPSLREAVESVHRPEEASAVTVPMAVAPSYSTTVDEATAVPTIAGAVTLVSVSVVEPLFEPAVSVGAVGVAGGGVVLR
nr:hypothetical protein [Azospirillum brasilense]